MRTSIRACKPACGRLHTRNCSPACKRGPPHAQKHKPTHERVRARRRRTQASGQAAHHEMLRQLVTLAGVLLLAECQASATHEVLQASPVSTIPKKNHVTNKSPVGDISAVTLIRTDTTLDHSQKAEKVCWEIWRQGRRTRQHANNLCGSPSISALAGELPIIIVWLAG